MIATAARAVLLLALCAIPTSQSKPRSAPRPVPVLMLLGQSNALGATAGFWLANALNEDNEHPELASQENVKIWWPGGSPRRPDSTPAWESYRVGSLAPENNGSYPSDNVYGPEASFGDAAQRYFGEPVYVFKYTAVSALDPDAEASWTKSRSGKGLYHDMLAEWRRAAEALVARGLAPHVRGIFFVQGESDCQPHNADKYEKRLRAFLGNLRADVARERGGSRWRPRSRAPIPVVLGQLHDRHTPRESWSEAEALVRKAQADVARADRRCALCETTDIPIEDGNSGIHFTAAGTIQLGYLLFAALEGLPGVVEAGKKGGG